MHKHIVCAEYSVCVCVCACVCVVKEIGRYGCHVSLRGKETGCTDMSWIYMAPDSSLVEFYGIWTKFLTSFEHKQLLKEDT